MGQWPLLGRGGDERVVLNRAGRGVEKEACLDACTVTEQRRSEQTAPSLRASSARGREYVGDSCWLS